MSGSLAPHLIASLLVVSCVIEPQMSNGVALPRIEKTSVVFVGGKVVDLWERRTHHENPEEALQLGEPVWSTQKAVVPAGWSRVLIITDDHMFEDVIRRVLVLDYRGNPLGPPTYFRGDLEILQTRKRILLAQRSSHYEVNHSVLLDQDGNIVRRIQHGRDVISVGHSADERVFWIMTAQVEQDRPLVWLQVFDSDGGGVESAKVFEQGTVTIDFEGKSYEVAIPEPDYPG